MGLNFAGHQTAFPSIPTCSQSGETQTVTRFPFRRTSFRTKSVRTFLTYPFNKLLILHIFSCPTVTARMSRVQTEKMTARAIQKRLFLGLPPSLECVPEVKKQAIPIWGWESRRGVDIPKVDSFGTSVWLRLGATRQSGRPDRSVAGAEPDGAATTAPQPSAHQRSKLQARALPRALQSVRSKGSAVVSTNGDPSPPAASRAEYACIQSRPGSDFGSRYLVHAAMSQLRQSTGWTLCASCSVLRTYTASSSATRSSRPRYERQDCSGFPLI